MTCDNWWSKGKWNKEQGKHGQKCGQRQRMDREGRRQVGDGGNRSSMMPRTGSRDVGAVPSRGHGRAVGRACPCPRDISTLTSGMADMWKNRKIWTATHKERFTLTTSHLRKRTYKQYPYGDSKNGTNTCLTWR